MAEPSRRPGLDPASGAIRNAVRAALTRSAGARSAGTVPRVVIAVSGGADSMALLHACAFLHRRGEVEAHAVTVDHGLQPGSAEVAAEVVAAATAWGVPAEVAAVTVVPGEEGIEAAARVARYEALDEARVRVGATWVLTAHTRGDQAETVLLGLLRGSGTRSLSGMAERSGTVLRPLLEIDRAATEASCAAQGIAVWDDPMNADRSFARVRVRALLASLEDDLGQPVTDNLARTAGLCRADADYLDAVAGGVVAEIRGQETVPVERLGDLDDAILTRALRGWLISLGVPAQSFGAARIAELAALIRRHAGAASATGAAPATGGGAPATTHLSLPGDTEVVVGGGLVCFGLAAKAPRT